MDSLKSSSLVEIQDTTPAAMQPRIQAHLDWLQNHPTWSGRTELLCSVPGVGSVAAAVLVAELPELGQFGSRQLACLGRCGVPEPGPWPSYAANAASRVAAPPCTGSFAWSP
ncbi:MAG: transposase [Caldilineaceae bacterium]|nr:transposase [Caldilineaceae bacterium]